MRYYIALLVSLMLVGCDVKDGDLSTGASEPPTGSVENTVIGSDEDVAEEGMSANFAEDEAIAAARSKVIDILRSDEEPTAKDASWSGSILTVGAFDDGSSRDGYAEYVCLLIGDYDALKGTDSEVIIRDYQQILRDEWPKKLGHSRCY